MRLIMLLLLLTSCSREPEYSFRETSSIFSSTEEYQIMCWVIKKHEGYSSSSYKCQAGKSTRGWGFTNARDFDDIEEADEIFKEIIEKLYQEVHSTYPEMDYLKCAALVSLYYNTGNLKSIKKSQFMKHLSNDNVTKAIKEFKNWNKVKIGKGKFMISKGLTSRRSYESKLLSGKFTRKDYNILKSEVSKIYIKNKI